MKKDKLKYLEEINQKATAAPWIPKDLSQGLQNNSDIILLIELRNNAANLIDAGKQLLWSQEWYATRLETLRALCEKNGLLTEFCNIVANGKESSDSPPTYQNQINAIKLERDKAIAETGQAYKDMDRMERSFLLRLREKEKECKTYRDLLLEVVDELSSQHDAEDSMNMIRKIDSALEAFEIEGSSPEK
jgi:DNA-binding transcriptional ArsR family regulator